MGGDEFVRDLAKDRKKRQYGLYPALDIRKCCPDKYHSVAPQTYFQACNSEVSQMTLKGTMFRPKTLFTRY
jgi:hypothetical protein